MAECFAATSTFAQYRFGKFFKAQLLENVHNVINSSVRSDILDFNCYLCHVRFLLTCYVCGTKIGENSDIFKCFEDIVSQGLGVLTRIYAAELRSLHESGMFRRRKNGFKLAGKERKYVSLQSEFKKRIIKKALSFACRL